MGKFIWVSLYCKVSELFDARLDMHPKLVLLSEPDGFDPSPRHMYARSLAHSILF
jgi:hypothetical protein